MKEINVKITRAKINYTDKKDGTPKEMDCVNLEFANGSSFNLVSGRFNYRVFDYLNDVLDGIQG